MLRRSPAPTFRRASLLLGFGLGGLADGIVLHQVLQWHNLTSNRIPDSTVAGLRTNVLWDGVFHLTVTALVVVAVGMLVSAASDAGARTNRSLIAGVLVGWGAFHVVDQVVFHLILRLHDIRPDAANPALYNWGFFAIGVAMAVAGWWVGRETDSSVSPQP